MDYNGVYLYIFTPIGNQIDAPWPSTRYRRKLPIFLYFCLTSAPFAITLQPAGLEPQSLVVTWLCKSSPSKPAKLQNPSVQFPRRHLLLLITQP